MTRVKCTYPAAIVLLFFAWASCTTRARIDDVVKGFFGEINGSNFESAKAKYLAASLINELNAPSPMRALAPLHKTIQQSFQAVAGGIDSIEVGSEEIKGEQATVATTLVMKWGTKESGGIELIKEAGKTWKISEWGEFKALGSEHAVNAARLCNARNLDAALPEYQAAIAENPRDSMTVFNMGWCYEFLGKLNEAEAEYKRSIQMHPDALWDPYLRLGGIYQYRGDIAQAEQAYQKAIKNKPDYTFAYNALAWMYAEKGIKLDQAIELAQKAVGLAPNSCSFLDTLGWAYYRKGDRAQALKYLASAVAKPSDNREINAQINAHYQEVSSTAEVHLARARQLLNQRQFDQAFGECEAALRQEPSNEQAKTLKTTIGKEAAVTHVASAQQAFERQQYDSALSECDAALRYDPKNAEATSLRAKIAEVKKILGS